MYFDNGVNIPRFSLGFFNELLRTTIKQMGLSEYTNIEMYGKPGLKAYKATGN
jgi:hypothetical protein